MKYAEIAVEVDAAVGERLSVALVAEGLAIEERDATTLLKPPPGRTLLVAWVAAAETAATRALVDEVLRREGLVAEVRLLERDEDEWRDAWKQFFHPRSVGPFAIVPSWHAAGYRPPPEVTTVIRLDPGRAFGTGGHASTRLCLEFLGRMGPAASVLDVGCGSGILGIGCALRWPTCRVTAIDVDPEAAATTRENAADNAVADRIAASTTPLADVPGAFPLVLANIQADVLIGLADPLARRAAGRLVLSGVLVEQAEEVATAFAALGLREEARAADEGWCALVLRPGRPETGNR